MIQVNVQEAKTHLSRLLTAVEQGEEVVVSRNGTPIARLEPIRAPQERELGFVAGSLPDTFFDELPAEELTAWEGR